MSIIELIRENHVDLLRCVNQGGCRKGIYLYLNPKTYLYARKHPEQYAKTTGLRFDGTLFTLLLRLVLGVRVKRQSFDLTSLAPAVLGYAVTEQRTVALVGGTQDDVEAVAEFLSDTFPGLPIVLTHSGYFRGSEAKQLLLRRIEDTAPDIVLIGMGGVLQDRMALELSEIGFGGVVHTCGAFISQTARQGVYFPEWIDRLNLRWAYRIVKEPRVFTRILVYYPAFVGFFLWDAVQFLFADRAS